MGGNFYVVKLYERMQAELDGSSREIFERMLLDEFMQEEFQELGMNVHILPDTPNPGGI